jgi:hypothetical protein
LARSEESRATAVSALRVQGGASDLKAAPDCRRWRRLHRTAHRAVAHGTNVALRRLAVTIKDWMADWLLCAVSHGRGKQVAGLLF